MAGGAVTGENIAKRIETALARIEAARRVEAPRDSGADARLRALQQVVEATVGDLDALIAVGSR